jgi:septin family protein
MPFSVIGSEDNVKLGDGTQVRGRQYPWGVVQGKQKIIC